MSKISVGYFPFNPGSNPYQSLFAESLEQAGCRVHRLLPRKLFPLQYVSASRVDILQFDWPHDWYRGRTYTSQVLKQLMYFDGLRRLRTRKVVWTAHNLQAHDSADPHLERQMIQRLINVCDGVIALSKISEEILKTEYEIPDQTKVTIVHHGHYIESYKNSVTRADARKQLGLSSDSRVVISIGRLQPYKGLEDLVRAFAAIATSKDVLIIAGKAIDVDYHRRLVELISGFSGPQIDIRLHCEFVPDNELQIYYNACDIVAMPFAKVLNSGSLLLAMSFGCAVVAPRVGSIPEIACPFGTYLYGPLELNGLEKQLLNGLSDASSKYAQRAKIIEYARRHYSWQQVGERVSKLYSDIVCTA